MSNEIADRYETFYRKRKADFVYPVEFIVRAFLGSYPRLQNQPEIFAGKNILDLGFGDGRNMPLFWNLGMTVYGVEISEEICQRGAARMQQLGVKVENRVGRNFRIPFQDAFFDHL